MKKIVLNFVLLIPLILFSACQTGSGINSNPDLQATNDNLVRQLTIQAAISSTLQKVIPSSSPTKVNYPTQTSGYLSFASQDWRFDVIEGGEKIGDDASVNREWQDSIAVHARNLAVGNPYYWEEIKLPDNTRYADIEDYYGKIAKDHGYKLGRSEQGMTVAGGETYLLTFVRGSGKNASRVVLEFWPKAGNFNADMIIIYSNP
jgi:hypothetical protein